MACDDGIVRLAQSLTDELASCGEVEVGHLFGPIRQPNGAHAILERVGDAERLPVGSWYQGANRLVRVGVNLQHRVAHEHLQRGDGRALTRAHELHELALLHAEVDAAHVIQRSFVNLRQVIELLSKEVVRVVLRQLVGPAKGVGLLAFEHGLSRHAQAVSWIVGPVLAAEVAIEHRLDEEVEAQPVAQGVKHREAHHVTLVGHVEVVPVGLGAAHRAQASLCHLHRKRILGIEEVSVAFDQGVGKVRRTLDHVVYCLLQDIAAHVRGDVHIHHVGPMWRRAIAVVHAAEVLLFDLEIGLCCHNATSLPAHLVSTDGILSAHQDC